MRFSGKKHGKRHGKSHKKSHRKNFKRNPVVCKTYKKVDCGSVDPNCGWRKKTGCVRKRLALRPKHVYAGPHNLQKKF
jgi:hypothetical protein